MLANMAIPTSSADGSLPIAAHAVMVIGPMSSMVVTLSSQKEMKAVSSVSTIVSAHMRPRLSLMANAHRTCVRASTHV